VALKDTAEKADADGAFRIRAFWKARVGRYVSANISTTERTADVPDVVAALWDIGSTAVAPELALDKRVAVAVNPGTNVAKGKDAPR
jgi:hypothetical protein